MRNNSDRMVVSVLFAVCVLWISFWVFTIGSALWMLFRFFGL